MIKLCVFDMDGLLLDSERQMYVAAGIYASNKLGRPINPNSFKRLMGGSWANYRKGLLEEYGQDYPMDDYFKIYNAFVDDKVNNSVIDLRPGVLDVLNYCKQKGIHMAIATSSNLEYTEKLLKHSNIREYFEFICTRDMVKETKPNPEIFLKAIDHFNIPHENAMVFEDGHNGALAAQNGHLRLTVVEDLALLTDEDKAYSDHVTTNISTIIDFIEKENETAARN